MMSRAVTHRRSSSRLHSGVANDSADRPCSREGRYVDLRLKNTSYFKLLHELIDTSGILINQAQGRVDHAQLAVTMGAPINQWRKLFQQCLSRRVGVHDLQKLLGVLWRRSSLAEASIVDALLECRPATGQYDPLISLYMDLLIKLGLVKIPTVLKELFQYSSIAPKDERLVDLNAKATTLMADTRIVQDVMILLSSGNCSLSLSETVAIFSVLADWILAIVRWHNSNLSEDQQTGGIQSSSDASSLFESIGILFVAVSGLEKGLEALSLDKPEGACEMLWSLVDRVSHVP